MLLRGTVPLYYSTSLVRIHPFRLNEGVSMATQVRTCPKCSLLMWVKEGEIEHEDEDTIRLKCPHCRETVRFKLVSQGSNAAGPKMGH